MILEYTGKSNEDAVEKAVLELGLGENDFDVEVLPSKTGVFTRNKARIKVHVDYWKIPEGKRPNLVLSNEETQIQEFIENIILNMGYQGDANLIAREADSIVFEIKTEDSAILIGKKGKNLDALQLLANVYAEKVMGEGYSKVVLDLEGYRKRREEQLFSMAEKTAAMVLKKQRSRLLEPLNPYERRLVHTYLSKYNDLVTKSEGDGVYRQIRVIYKRPKR